MTAHALAEPTETELKWKAYFKSKVQYKEVAFISRPDITNPGNSELKLCLK